MSFKGRRATGGPFCTDKAQDAGGPTVRRRRHGHDGRAHFSRNGDFMCDSALACDALGWHAGHLLTRAPWRMWRL